MTILAGDVGGTKIRLGLHTLKNQELQRTVVKQYESAKYASLSEVIKIFLDENKASVQTACFGIPGPVINGTVKVTNLPWTLSESELSSSLNIAKVRLVNDLVATAAAVPYFAADDFVTLHPGKELGKNGIAAVVAPGTGLGQAILTVKDGKVEALASEGGHANFAPNSEIEAELFLHLKKKFSHVSIEHVLCGPGLLNIYNFLKDTNYAKEAPELADEIKTRPAAAVITSFALENKSDLCVKTLDIFVNILGAHCSNLLLTVLATGGIFLGGGIPPKIMKKLTDGTILEPYLAKGKMRDQVAITALKVIKDDHAALSGAARIAASL